LSYNIWTPEFNINELTAAPWLKNVRKLKKAMSYFFNPKAYTYITIEGLFNLPVKFIT